MRPTVEDTLKAIGAIDGQRAELFSTRTRDNEVQVWRDPMTRVIYLSNFYLGDDHYKNGAYRSNESGWDFQAFKDTQRRVRDFDYLYFGKSVLDFGCGHGDFLSSIQSQTISVTGIEIQDSLRDALDARGIGNAASISDVSGRFHAIFMFHVLEHLPDPATTLADLKTRLESSEGSLVIEVPHARDILLDDLACEPFKKFTLWSQHLVLHTRDSLERLLRYVGFKEVDVFGVQRYGLSNHLQWLGKGRPGGQRGRLSLMETPALFAEYSRALAAKDRTDTLIAIAR